MVKYIHTPVQLSAWNGELLARKDPLGIARTIQYRVSIALLDDPSSQPVVAYCTGKGAGKPGRASYGSAELTEAL